MADIIVEKQKRGLGRGLGSLLGSNVPAAPASPAATPLTSQTKVGVTNNNNTQSPSSVSPSRTETPKPAPSPQPLSEGKIWQMSIEKLKSGVFQPRKHFEKEKLQELSQSIKSNGILQPIVVRKSGENFEIVAGERRWRAAQIAGLHEVPVIIKNFSDRETLELSIIENVQREDLNPIEEADGYLRLQTEFSLSHQQIAEKVGKDRATISNALRLLQLPKEIREMLINSDISTGHAKVLLSVEEPARQLELAKICRDEKTSVRKLETMAKRKVEPEGSEPDVDLNVTNRLMKGLADELQKLLGTKVNIDYHNSKGKISIAFYSDEELTQLIDKIKEGCQI
ncbi:MAG: ParB/RepB/Spo0J family partition protein [Bdellovibrionaceae bacterium]|nr:ParB/RepB/Spo0J family partition protein [Pseudobdellovibrionaceae bacterium]